MFGGTLALAAIEEAQNAAHIACGGTDACNYCAAEARAAFRDWLELQAPPPSSGAGVPASTTHCTHHKEFQYDCLECSDALEARRSMYAGA